jgi:hypothetical protein
MMSSSPRLGDKEWHFLMNMFSLNVEVNVFSEKTSFVLSPINIPYLMRLCQPLCSQSHLFCETGIYEVVGGSQINKSLFVGHRVTCAK